MTVPDGGRARRNKDDVSNGAIVAVFTRKIC
jgi:hypothetical protein